MENELNLFSKVMILALRPWSQILSLLAKVKD